MTPSSISRMLLRGPLYLAIPTMSSQLKVFPFGLGAFFGLSNMPSLVSWTTNSVPGFQRRAVRIAFGIAICPRADNFVIWIIGAPSKRLSQAIWTQARRGQLQQRRQLLRRPRDDRTVATNHDRTLHQFRMLQQQRDDFFLIDIVLRLEAQFAEAFILPHEVGGRPFQHREDFFQRLSRRGRFEILDHVAFDAALV